MTKQEAEELAEALREQCLKRGLWLQEERKYKPELKDIILTVSIKIK